MEVYLDPQSMRINGIYGCYYGFRAIILHDLGVQVGFRFTARGLRFGVYGCDFRC